MLRIKITPHPRWLKDSLDFLEPYEERVVGHRMFQDVAAGRLSANQFHGALVNFYPLIESFPKYMGLSLAKVPAGNVKRDEQARYWLITNMNQERIHTAWWRQWAAGFGVPGTAFENEIHPPPEMDAINNYLWRACTHGSLAEGVSASNYAVEGPTGKWTKKINKSLRKYYGSGNDESDRKAFEWVSAHASYDDRHPHEALEIIKAYATTGEEQAKVRHAAKRALEYYALALDACYERFK
jgi:pyrroloquinoline quinone (PQQ) biosynthesis protein C